MKNTLDTDTVVALAVTHGLKVAAHPAPIKQATRYLQQAGVKVVRKSKTTFTVRQPLASQVEARADELLDQQVTK